MGRTSAAKRFSVSEPLVSESLLLPEPSARCRAAGPPAAAALPVPAAAAGGSDANGLSASARAPCVPTARFPMGAAGSVLGRVHTACATAMRGTTVAAAPETGAAALAGGAAAGHGGSLPRPEMDGADDARSTAMLGACSCSRTGCGWDAERAPVPLTSRTNLGSLRSCSGSFRARCVRPAPTACVAALAAARLDSACQRACCAARLSPGPAPALDPALACAGGRLPTTAVCFRLAPGASEAAASGAAEDVTVGPHGKRPPSSSQTRARLSTPESAVGAAARRLRPRPPWVLPRARAATGPAAGPARPSAGAAAAQAAGSPGANPDPDTTTASGAAAQGAPLVPTAAGASVLLGAVAPCPCRSTMRVPAAARSVGRCASAAVAPDVTCAPGRRRHQQHAGAACSSVQACPATTCRPGMAPRHIHTQVACGAWQRILITLTRAASAR